MRVLTAEADIQQLLTRPLFLFASDEVDVAAELIDADVGGTPLGGLVVRTIGVGICASRANNIIVCTLGGGTPVDGAVPSFGGVIPFVD